MLFLGFMIDLERWSTILNLSFFFTQSVNLLSITLGFSAFRRRRKERLLKTIAVPWTSIFSMLFELNVELNKHIGERKQFDDITLIALRRKFTKNRNDHAICRPARLEILDELCEFVESTSRHCGLSKGDTLAFKLATDKFCTNIIRNGYKDREPGLLSLFFFVEDNTAHLIINDDGDPLSPIALNTSDVNEGLKALSDNAKYNHTDKSFNQLELTKKLS